MLERYGRANPGMNEEIAALLMAGRQRLEKAAVIPRKRF